MFRDTLSVSWSYSCYILCCWLAINILIVLAFFPSLPLAVLEWSSPNSIQHFGISIGVWKIFKKMCLFLLFDFDLPKLEKIMLKLFSAEYQVENWWFESWSPHVTLFFFRIMTFYKDFDSSTIIPKYIQDWLVWNPL